MGVSRRRFMVLGTAASGALVTAVLGVPLVGFLLSPLFKRQEILVERLVGDISKVPENSPTRFLVKFPENEWDASTQLEYTVFVVRTSGRLYVFSNTCTHMQCPVRWEKGMGMFLCPCHGGLYQMDGTNVGGPPPKPLPQFVHRLEGNMLYVKNRYEETF
jgi:quinol---cytochrome c reductase iron-sulfur subunit, bacillus type